MPPPTGARRLVRTVYRRSLPTEPVSPGRERPGGAAPARAYAYSRPQHADRNFTTTSASGLMGPIGGDAAAPGDRAQRKKFCAVCGVRANLQACARCGNAFYCSKAHQESHWKEHRRDCKKARAGGK